MLADASRHRIGFIDAARTLAMLLMVQGHVCDNLLSAAGKASAFYHRHLFVRGLTGPLFFFISGFAFVAASDRIWDEFRRPSPALWGRVRRALMLLAVGTFLQIPRWSGPAFTADEWRYVFRVGVLHAIALSLLTALALIALTRSKRAFAWVAMGVAIAAVVAAPYFDQAAWLPRPLGLLTRTREGSLFPILPWIAHFMLGSAMARLYLDRPEVGSVRRLGVLTACTGGLMLAVSAAWQALVPVDSSTLAVWVSDPSVFLWRMGLAWCVFGAFALVLGNVASRPWLKAVASHALSIFVAHLVALYGFPGFDGLVQRFQGTFGLARTYLTGPLLFLACAAVVIGLDGLAGWARRAGKQAWARVFPAGAQG